MSKRIREVRVKDLVLYFALPLVLLIVLTVACVLTCIFVNEIHNAYFIVGTVLLSYYPLKYFAIGCVLLYKAFAPISVREKCRFEPCCSTYMIMAIQKYGLIIGVMRGLRRITKCKPPNGGTDLP